MKGRQVVSQHDADYYILDIVHLGCEIRWFRKDRRPVPARRFP